MMTPFKLLALALPLLIASGSCFAEEDWSDRLDAYTKKVYTQVMLEEDGIRVTRNHGIVTACGYKELSREAIQAILPKLQWRIGQVMAKLPQTSAMKDQELFAVANTVRLLTAAQTAASESTARVLKVLMKDSWETVCEVTASSVRAEMEKNRQWVEPKP